MQVRHFRVSRFIYFLLTCTDRSHSSGQAAAISREPEACLLGHMEQKEQVDKRQEAFWQGPKLLRLWLRQVASCFCLYACVFIIWNLIVLNFKSSACVFIDVRYYFLGHRLDVYFYFSAMTTGRRRSRERVSATTRQTKRRRTTMRWPFSCLLKMSCLCVAHLWRWFRHCIEVRAAEKTKLNLVRNFFIMFHFSSSIVGRQQVLCAPRLSVWRGGKSWRRRSFQSWDW